MNNEVSISFFKYFHKNRSIQSLDSSEQNKALTKLCQLYNYQNEFNRNNTKYYNFEKFKIFNQYFKYSSDDLNKNLPFILKNIFDKLKNQVSSSKTVNSKCLSSIDASGTLIELTHGVIEEISNLIIISINSFMNTKNYQKKLYDLFEGKNKLIELISQNNENEIKMLETLESIKEIKFIANDESIYIDLDKILLFYLFYRIIFPYVLNININLNISGLNKIYSTKEKGIKAVYSMKSEEIKKISSEYINCFLSNYLLIRTICENCSSVQLTLTQIDDYIIEIEDLFIRQGMNFNNKQEINLMFYNSFFNIPKILKFSMNINSLDNLLFKNFLVLLFSFLSMKTMIIEELDINLFPKEVHCSGVNYRKILLNKIFYEGLSQNDFLDYKEDTINWKYEKANGSENKKENKLISIKEEKILDLLFDDFSENLLMLILLLEKNIKSNKMRFILNLPKFLLDKKNYSSDVSLFIFNFFRLLERKAIYVKFNQLKIESNVYLSENLTRYGKVNLDKTIIQNIIIKLGYISRIIDFNYLPFESLDSIKLSNIFYEDLRDYFNSINNYNNSLRLLFVKIKLNYQTYIDYDLLLNLFKLGYCSSIENFYLKFKNEFNNDEIIKIIIKILNGCAYSEKTGNKTKVHVKLFYDINENLTFKDIFDKTFKAFDYENLNDNLLVTYHINKIKIKKEEGKKKCIKYKIIKLEREKKIDLYLKLLIRKSNIAKTNQEKLNLSTRIMSFLISPISTMEVSFHLKNE